MTATGFEPASPRRDLNPQSLAPRASTLSIRSRGALPVSYTASKQNERNSLTHLNLRCLRFLWDVLLQLLLEVITVTTKLMLTTSWHPITLVPEYSATWRPPAPACCAFSTGAAGGPLSEVNKRHAYPFHLFTDGIRYLVLGCAYQLSFHASTIPENDCSILSPADWRLVQQGQDDRGQG